MDVQSLSAIKKLREALVEMGRTLGDLIRGDNIEIGKKIDAQTVTLTTEHDATQALLGAVGAVLDKINGEVV